MSYPKTGHEVYVSLNLSNTMLTTLGRATITRDQVSADEMKRLFQKHGVIVSAKEEQLPILQVVTEKYGFEWELPQTLKLFQLSEDRRTLVVIMPQGLRRKGGSLLPEYSAEELEEATFMFVKYDVRSEQYEDLQARCGQLQQELAKKAAE